MERISQYLCCSALAAAATSLGLTGCGAIQNMQPSGVMPRSTTSSQAPKKLGGLLYVATGNNVYALSYPSGKLVLSLGISGYGLCSDVKGDVFVPRGDAGNVDEYDHDGRLIETLKDTDFAYSCAVDPTTGDLAVPWDSSGENYVTVYPHARGRGKSYGDGAVGIWGLSTYDSAGNLFVNGGSSSNVLAELQKGSASLMNYTLGKPFDRLDSLQRYETFLAVPNPSTEAIYQVKVVRGIVQIRGTSYLTGWYSAYSIYTGVQTWLDNGIFIAQYGSGAELGLWHYPKGGAATKILGPFITGNVNIYGVVLSRASR
jgi:hypothetical protein